jgi:hypothetical protein
MSKVETFAQLVEAIQQLPVSHRKTAFALECNAVAEAFHALRNDVVAAAKTSAPKAKPAPTKRRCRDRR